MRYCPVCGIRSASSPHHILPAAMGGTGNKKNIAFLCKTCHDLVEKIYDETGKMYSSEVVGLIRRQQGIPTSFSKTQDESKRDYMRCWFLAHRDKYRLYFRVRARISGMKHKAIAMAKAERGRGERSRRVEDYITLYEAKKEVEYKRLAREAIGILAWLVVSWSKNASTK